VSEPAVVVERLSKRYRIPAARAAGGSWLSRVPKVVGRSQDLWALRDVSFKVAPGEVLGIIGRNGAGKSTLLKVLSGITSPTCGRAVIRGRVSSLLEVGTGFHPDLTGRENVYLNGALLGMSRAEIRRKFDAIVSFAEVEGFLDAPIKHFSTGMQMRLAFAVAAHLEGEILVIDEALSVGDAAFQAKCVEAMAAARSSGRTVLLVSHNIGVLRGLVGRAILLNEGRLEADGPMQEVFGRYMASGQDVAEIDLRGYAHRDGTGEARIERLVLLGPAGNPTNHVPVGGPLHLRFRVRFARVIGEPQFIVRIYSPEGEALVDLQGRHDGLSVGRASGAYDVDVRVESLGLYPGRYLLSLWACDRTLRRVLDCAEHCATLVVDPGDPTGRGIRLNPQFGRFFVPSRWSVRTADRPRPLEPVGA